MALTGIVLTQRPDTWQEPDRSLLDAVDAILARWMDTSTGPQAFALVDDHGTTVAVLIRAPMEPDVAYMLLQDGSSVAFRCRRFDPDAGLDLRPQIVQLGRWVHPRHPKWSPVAGWEIIPQHQAAPTSADSEAGRSDYH